MSLISATHDEKKGTLTLVLQTHAPRPSSSGKTMLVAGTGGFVDADVTIHGQPVKVSVNANIPAVPAGH